MKTAIAETKAEETRILFRSFLSKAATRKQQLEAEYGVVKLLQQAEVIPLGLVQALKGRILLQITEDIADLETFIPGSIIDTTLNDMEKYEFVGMGEKFDPDEHGNTPEWKAAHAANDAEIDRIQTVVLRAYGELELADILERNRKKYEDLLNSEEGYFKQ